MAKISCRVTKNNIEKHEEEEKYRQWRKRVEMINVIEKRKHGIEKYRISMSNNQQQQHRRKKNGVSKTYQRNDVITAYNQ